MSYDKENILTKVLIDHQVTPRWGRIATLIAQELEVPCVCIMKLSEEELEVFYTNQSTRNPCHQGQKICIGIGLRHCLQAS
ncbi:MAG: hypothetical protein D3910_09760, partial [Candidatus Electrothrix sp. ATG2]|nr:hypothetical protein [Candidatus Electrothrix sp. ATG2]